MKKEITYLLLDGLPAVVVENHEAKTIKAWILRDGKWEKESPAVASFEGRLYPKDLLGDLPELPAEA